MQYNSKSEMATDYWIGFINARQKDEFCMMLLSEGILKEVISGGKDEILVISKEHEEEFWKLVAGNFIAPTSMISATKEAIEREPLFVNIIRIAVE